MSKKKDILRADYNKDFDLPPCSYCGGKVYIQDFGGQYRVFHFCKGTDDYKLGTIFCKTPEEAVELYLKGEYKRVKRWEAIK